MAKTMTKTNDNQTTQDVETPSESAWLQRLVMPCGVTLYQGDCMDILPHLSGIDAVITDPPYGIGINPQRFDSASLQNKNNSKGAQGGELSRNAYKDKCEWDASFDASELLIKIDSNVQVAMWGADYYRDTLPKGGSWLAWDKKQKGMEKLPGTDFELCWLRKPKAKRILRYVWTGYLAKEKDAKRVHPTQKPIRAMAWCMEQAGVSEDATILDPYMGSGSTIIAAIRTGRKAIGIEKDPEHFEAAKERIERELSQLDLFLA